MRTDMSAEVNELAQALAKAQGSMTFAHKDSSNPFFKSKYADLSAVWDAIREPLSTNGIAVVQTTDTDVGTITVITKLLHSSGQWIEGRLTMAPEKGGPQAYGSTLTYMRRYALAAIAGIAQADDDAEAATNRNGKKQAEPEDAALWMAAELAAKKGVDALHAWWEKLPKEKRAVLAADGARWEKAKHIAADVDAAKEAA